MKVMPMMCLLQKKLLTIAVKPIQQLKMRKSILRLLIVVVLSISFLTINAQASSGLRISLITCSPGQELYSTFGHSAIRVMDSARSSDWVFNYGTFDFNDPDFYTKFIQGKLLYFVSLERTVDFISQYQYEQRKVIEQELQLNESEKLFIQQYLFENLKPENRFYKYDFFFDNCTTRLRDLMEKGKQPRPLFPAVMPENTRFRQAIHAYLDKGHQDWSKLGIDLLLGARTDRVMKINEQQFLPDNLMFAIEQCSNQKIVHQTSTLYEPNGTIENESAITPLQVSLLICVLFLGLSLYEKKNRSIKISLSILDTMLFLWVGLLGFILVFAWFGTDHIMTKNNYNLAWALPGLMIFPLLRSTINTWTKRYIRLHTFILALTLCVWIWLPQQLNTALIPIVFTLFVRTYQKAPWYAKNRN